MYFALGSLALSLGVFFWYRRKSGNSKPPGPPPLPVIGNLLDVPRKAEAHAYSLMADQYGKYINFPFNHTRLHALIIGDMVYMSVLGKNIYVISSVHILNDLFNKRSANYSDRPYSTMLNKLYSICPHPCKVYILNLFKGWIWSGSFLSNHTVRHSG